MTTTTTMLDSKHQSGAERSRWVSRSLAALVLMATIVAGTELTGPSPAAASYFGSAPSGRCDSTLDSFEVLHGLKGEYRLPEYGVARYMVQVYDSNSRTWRNYWREPVAHYVTLRADTAELGTKWSVRPGRHYRISSLELWYPQGGTMRKWGPYRVTSYTTNYGARLSYGCPVY